MTVRMEPVQSTNVEAVGYDPAGGKLHVRFRGGSTYVHHGVTAAQHRDFMSATSKGSHYHQHFKGRYGVSKVS